MAMHLKRGHMRFSMGLLTLYWLKLVPINFEKSQKIHFLGRMSSFYLQIASLKLFSLWKICELTNSFSKVTRQQIWVVIDWCTLYPTNNIEIFRKSSRNGLSVVVFMAISYKQLVYANSYLGNWSSWFRKITTTPM